MRFAVGVLPCNPVHPVGHVLVALREDLEQVARNVHVLLVKEGSSQAQVTDTTWREGHIGGRGSRHDL